MIADGNRAAKEAFHHWTGYTIPIHEPIEEHKQADLLAWEALKIGDTKQLASLVCYKEEIAGIMHETIKTPIDPSTIVILTKPC